MTTEKPSSRGDISEWVSTPPDRITGSASDEYDEYLEYVVETSQASPTEGV